MTVQEAEKPNRTTEATDLASSPVPKPVIAFFAAMRKIFGKAEDSRETIRKPPAVERGTWDLEVIVEADELDGGFVAECRDIPGAMAQGETEEEAFENLIDAIQGIIAAKMEEHFRSLNFDIPPDVARRITIQL